MRRHQGDGQRTAGEQHGKVPDIGTCCKKLRLSRKGKSCTVQVALVHGAGHHCCKLPGEGTAGRFLKGSNGLHRTFLIGMSGVPRRGIPDHFQAHAFGRVEQRGGKQFRSHSGRVSRYQSKEGSVHRIAGQSGCRGTKES